ncbi:hypothetical protein BGX29_004686 [Mortierella sp. GBA35]|nr:hypothetical protein BGX29_004686 [Mortierella sp. GBA35]
MRSVFIPIPTTPLYVVHTKRRSPAALSRSGEETICLWNGRYIRLDHPMPGKEVLAKGNNYRRTISDLVTGDWIEAEGWMIRTFLHDIGSENAADPSWLSFSITRPWTYLGWVHPRSGVSRTQSWTFVGRTQYPPYGHGNRCFTLPRRTYGRDDDYEQVESVKSFQKNQAVNKRPYAVEVIDLTGDSDEEDDSEKDVPSIRSGLAPRKRARMSAFAGAEFPSSRSLQEVPERHRVGRNSLVRPAQGLDGRAQRPKEEKKKEFQWSDLKPWSDKEWSAEDELFWNEMVSSVVKEA